MLALNVNHATLQKYYKQTLPLTDAVWLSHIPTSADKLKTSSLMFPLKVEIYFPTLMGCDEMDSAVHPCYELSQWNYVHHLT
jgi:hypothetical protein